LQKFRLAKQAIHRSRVDLLRAMSQSYYVRNATEGDMPQILEIYNEQIETSSSLFISSKVDLQNRLEWFRSCKNKGHPVLVAATKTGELNGQGNNKEEVAAYCSLGTFRDKPAYNA
jgi:L-amino acid N-acyltransferase YncA